MNNRNLFQQQHPQEPSLRPLNNGNTQRDHEDSVSALSEDRTSASKLSMWEQTKMILMGQNPNVVIEEEKTEVHEEYPTNGVIGISIDASARSGNGSGGILSRRVQQQPLSSSLKRVEFKNDNDHLTNGLGNSNNQVESALPKMSDVSSKRSFATDGTSSTVSIIKGSVDFLKDSLDEMTWGRRIALYLSKRFSWYNPDLKKSENSTESQELSQQGVGDSTDSGVVILTEENKKDVILNDAYPFVHSVREKPSLERAWAYFEHVAMPRYIVQPKAPGPKKNICTRIFRRLFMKGDQQLTRAEPGEDGVKTALYHPVFTPHKQLGDFGIGIGLYFSTLRAITVMTFFAGILNSANLLYFSSDQYNNPLNPSVANATLQFVVKGSAICTDTSWVLCEDGCLENRNEFPGRIGTGTNTLTNENATFVLRNNCNGATIEQGMISYATLLLIMIGTIILNVYLERMEVAFDEDEQTAQDYSILVSNPPQDATEPQEWHDFFREAFGAHVTACTVAVDNDLLVRTLVRRRELLRQIEMLVDPGTSLNSLNLARVAAKIESERRFFGKIMAFFVSGIPEYFSQLTVMNAKVQGLAQQHYPATNVFISFETEQAQRDVLSAYNLGSIYVKRNDTSKVKPQHLFRGNLVLKVSEPEEPSTVRWSDLNEKFKDRVKQQFFTILTTIVAIAVLATVIQILNARDSTAAVTAYTIAAFNVAFPMFAKSLTQLESHKSASELQRSMYFKIALFRWVNTAVVISIITPFTKSLQNKALINQVYALFFAEISTCNIIQLADPFGHIQRHFLAPRATTQDAMNLLMQGTEYELAERYTAMTKLLFLACWYCAIYPGAFFLCSLALLIMYFTDRFAMMRTWKRAPQLGGKISQFSREYFFPVAIVCMGIISSYYWASFPFDNVCDTSAAVPTSTVGNWTVNLIPIKKSGITTNTTYSVVVSESDSQYKFCVQDFLRYPKGNVPFPFVPRNQIPGSEWMTNEQEIITNIYGWSTLGVACYVFGTFFWQWYLSMKSYFYGTYEACGDDMGVNFSDVPSMNTYVPEVRSQVFSYPLLACNIDDIDPELLEWNDPDKPFSFYDLTKDAEVLLRGKGIGSQGVFSKISHWPPPGKDRRDSRELNISKH